MGSIKSLLPAPRGVGTADCTDKIYDFPDKKSLSRPFRKCCCYLSSLKRAKDAESAPPTDERAIRPSDKTRGQWPIEPASERYLHLLISHYIYLHDPDKYDNLL